MTLTPSLPASASCWVSAVPSIEATISALAPLFSIDSICCCCCGTVSLAYCRSTL